MNCGKFRAKYPQGELFGYSFNQSNLLASTNNGPGTSTLVDLSQISRKMQAQQVELSAGIRRELARMWVFIRNTPEVVAGLEPKDKDQLLELTYLTNNSRGLMVGAAMYKVGLSAQEKGMDVFGLATGDRRDCGNAGAMYQKATPDGGTLAMGIVRLEGGTHAIGMDTRNGAFTMFDPNMGMFRMALGPRAKAMLEDYFSIEPYRAVSLRRYTRCN